LKISEELLSGKLKIAVWGSGYIGLSTLANYANRGVKCIGVDTNEEVVKKTNMGEIWVSDLDRWLMYPFSPLVKSGLIKATSDWRSVVGSEDVAVHFIAIPTEKNGGPWDEPLKDVIKKISYSKRTPTIIIVESTLVPGWTDEIIIPFLEKSGKIVGKDILVGVAPRRDWFDDPTKNLWTLPRVCAGTDKYTTEQIVDILSIVCGKLVPVSNHKHAEIVKSVENAFRQLNIAYAEMLSRAFPDIDINEVIDAAATKWNYLPHYPRAGTGGYCIPLAPQYLMLGAKERKKEMKLLEEALRITFEQSYFVADIAKGLTKNSTISILGLSYKRETKTTILAPSLRIIERLKGKGLNIKVHDPKYSNDEIRSITHCEPMKYPDDLKDSDTILVVTGHYEYETTPIHTLLTVLKKDSHIIDVEGVWEKYRFILKKNGIDYRKIGDKNWSIVN